MINILWELEYAEYKRKKPTVTYQLHKDILGNPTIMLKTVLKLLSLQPILNLRQFHPSKNLKPDKSTLKKVSALLISNFYYKLFLFSAYSHKVQAIYYSHICLSLSAATLPPDLDLCNHFIIPRRTFDSNSESSPERKREMRDEDDEQMRRQCRSLPSLHSLSGISKLSSANIALDTIPEKTTIILLWCKNNNEFRIKHKQSARFKANKRNPKRFETTEKEKKLQNC